MSFFRTLWKNEAGQATVEYILVLSVMVGIAYSIIRKFIGPFFTRILNNTSARMEKTFGSNLHHFPVRR